MLTYRGMPRPVPKLGNEERTEGGIKAGEGAKDEGELEKTV